MDILNDPLRYVLKAAEVLWPDLRAEVQFAPAGHFRRCWFRRAKGGTRFPEDGSPPLIDISLHCTVIGAAMVLAHEFAHVKAGLDAGHNVTWKHYRDWLWVKAGQIAEDDYARFEATQS